MTNITIAGQIITPQQLKRDHGFVLLAPGKEPNTINFQYEGLVVAFHGGGDETKTQTALAAEIAREIARRGGINIHGGRNTGIMLAVSKAAPEASFGVLSQQQARKQTPFGKCAIVATKHCRLEILASMPPNAVICKGGIGTMQELITVLVGWKDNLGEYAPYPAPRPFVSEQWRPMLETMQKNGLLSNEIAKQLIFFSKPEDIFVSLFAPLEK